MANIHDQLTESTVTVTTTTYNQSHLFPPSLSLSYTHKHPRVDRNSTNPTSSDCNHVEHKHDA